MKYALILRLLQGIVHANATRKNKVVVIETVGTKKDPIEDTELIQGTQPSKERNSIVSTNLAIFNKIMDVMDDDEGNAQWLRVTFIKPLVNPFKGDVFLAVGISWMSYTTSSLV